MEITLIYVFHNGHKRGAMTFDCRLRIEAARRVALEKPSATIFFVGGQGISGAEDMQKFWQKKYPQMSNKLCLLKKANNTADAIKDIVENVLSYQEEKEVILISSAYHTKRISLFAKLNGLNAKILAAENILINIDDFNQKVKKYRNSFKYKLKSIADWVIFLYAAAIDDGQRLVKLWRKFTRKFK